MPNPDLASERRAFDPKWMEEQRPLFEAAFPNMPTTWRADIGQYEGDIQQYRWQGWLARSAVPTEVSEEMVEIAARALCEIDGPPDELLVKYRFDGKDLSHTRQPAWMFFTEKARACLTAALTVSSEREG